MGTRGWRRAFCTAIPRDAEVTLGDTNHHHHQHQQHQQQHNRHHLSNTQKCSNNPSPRSPKLSFFSSSSNSVSTNRSQLPHRSNLLRCRTTAAPVDGHNSSPKLLRNSTTPSTTTRSASRSASNSPRSPLKFSIFKTTRNNCGVCGQSVKGGGKRTAIYTAECGHAFHFPCIAAHVRDRHRRSHGGGGGAGSLACPVCDASWRDSPLLAALHNTAAAVDSEPETSSRPRSTCSYRDDEPILSPTTRAPFFSVPEADEPQQFQGFFVDPSVQNTSEDDLPRNVQVEISPESALISVGGGYETYAVAVKVKAPAAPSRHGAAALHHLDPSRRAPIDLVTVLDVSWSMSGAKLEMLKRAMRLVIASLGSADRLAIVAFAAAPKRLLPLTKMTAPGQRAARRIIDGLGCRGQGTSLADALRKATKALEDRRERNPVASVILLSDGQEERVAPNAAAASDHPRATADAPSTRFAHIEIPVRACGFGAKPEEDAFAKCVGGLLSVVAQDLRLRLGSSSAEIWAVYCCNGRPTALGSGTGDVRLGDLYAREERELVVELRTPATGATSSVGGAHHVVTVRCSYRDPASSHRERLVYGSERIITVVPAPRVGPTQAPSSSSGRSMMGNAERLRSVFIATRAAAESRRLVEQNEVCGAYHLLAAARALLLQMSCPGEGEAEAEEHVRWLEAELGEVRWRAAAAGEEQRRREMGVVVDENGDRLTPTSAWRTADRLARVATMKKSLSTRVSDLHGFENARF